METQMKKCISKGYAKTDNKIYELSEETIVLDNVLYVKDGPYWNMICAVGDNVYDTLDEVIDDYISVDKYSCSSRIGSIVSKKYIDKKANLDAEIIYAGIWTNNGLLYVAKLENTVIGPKKKEWVLI